MNVLVVVLVTGVDTEPLGDVETVPDVGIAVHPCQLEFTITLDIESISTTFFHSVFVHFPVYFLIPFADDGTSLVFLQTFR